MGAAHSSRIQALALKLLLQPFAEAAQRWIETTRHQGESAVRADYLEVLENRALPEEGYVLSLRA